MKTVGALSWGVGEPWSVEEIYLGDPRRDEVTVRMEAAGLCHSDHLAANAAIPSDGFPILGGHEGAGVVVEVGADVDDVAVGQHVVLSCVPSCGRCHHCLAGAPNLCDRGAFSQSGRAISDASFRVRARGRGVRPVALLGAFSPYAVVHRASVVPIDPAVPFEVACLLGCAIITGWASVTRVASVRPGEDVVVIGLGGVGMAALRGATAAGARSIVVIEPVEWKRDLALKWGATQAYPDLESATAGLAALTRGLMANAVIVAVAQPRGRDLDAWMTLTAKGGMCVLAAMADVHCQEVDVNLVIHILMQKRLQGSLLGNGDVRHDVGLLASMYLAGKLDLDGFVTARYRLDEINDAHRDMLGGRNIRGVIRYTEADWVR